MTSPSSCWAWRRRPTRRWCALARCRRSERVRSPPSPVRIVTARRRRRRWCLRPAARPHAGLGLDLHRGADDRRVVRGSQWPLQTGAAHLQGVRALDGVVFVQGPGDPPGQASDGPDVGAALPVDQHLTARRRPARGHTDPVRVGHQGGHELPNLIRCRLMGRGSPPPEKHDNGAGRSPRRSSTTTNVEIALGAYQEPDDSAHRSRATSSGPDRHAGCGDPGPDVGSVGPGDVGDEVGSVLARWGGRRRRSGGSGR